MMILHMHKKMLVLVLALMLLVPVLANCGGGSTEPPAQPIQPEQPADSGEPAQPADGGEPAQPADGGEPAQPAAVAPTPATPGVPMRTSYLQFGVVPHLYYTDHDRALQLTKNAGFDWIRQQVVWADTEGPGPEGTGGDYVWDNLDPIVESANAKGIKILISVVQSPPFYTADGSRGLPEDPEKLANFFEAMVTRYGDKVGAYEVWNEQNLAHETGGTIVPEDVGRYVEILIACYNRIKAINPNIFVLAGAPSSSGVTDPNIALSDLEYYQLMYTYRDGIINGHFDAQAVHPGGSANPPDTHWPDNPSTAQGWTDHSTFYFRHIEQVRAVMEEFGMGEHPVWITEYGWATANETPGYEFGNQVSFEQQAEYIARAMERTYEEYPWVDAMFLWNLNFAVTWQEHNPPEPMHEQASFGILNGDWSPRPAYLASQDMIARLKQLQGRPVESQ